jgi:hypothetical protein
MPMNGKMNPPKKVHWYIHSWSYIISADDAPHIFMFTTRDQLNPRDPECNITVQVAVHGWKLLHALYEGQSGRQEMLPASLDPTLVDMIATKLSDSFKRLPSLQQLIESANDGKFAK